MCVRVYFTQRCHTSHVSSYFRTYPTMTERIDWLFLNPNGFRYHIANLNCEHVARYVLTGEAESGQTSHITHLIKVRFVLVCMLAVIAAKVSTLPRQASRGPHRNSSVYTVGIEDCIPL